VDAGFANDANSAADAAPLDRGSTTPADWIDRATATELATEPAADAAASRKITSPPTFLNASVPRGALRSITADTCGRRAAEHLDDAYREYSVGAWASAEASAWQALERIATGLDVAAEATGTLPPFSAVAELRDGRRALREARDFVTAGVVIDAARMEAIAASHQTPVLHGDIPIGCTAAEAVDRYLDYARQQLTRLAQRHVRAAQAMDLIAAIALGRNDSDQLPEETALCLRRAALFGQPGNPSLAVQLGKQLAAMGLVDEAERTLRHALSLDASDDAAAALAAVMDRKGASASAARLVERVETPKANRPSRMPEVIELSPSEFAAISPPLNTGAIGAPSTGSAAGEVAQSFSAAGERPPRTERQRDTVPARVAGFRTPSPAAARSAARDAAANTADGQASGSAMKRWLKKFRNLW
jgi:tetratricopeptide (TPR) repeat protein